MNNKAQGALEYLLLIGGAVLVAVVVIVLLSMMSDFGMSEFDTPNETTKYIWHDTGDEITQERYNELNGICYVRCVDEGKLSGSVNTYFSSWDGEATIFNYCKCKSKPVCELIEKCSASGVCNLEEECITPWSSGTDLFTIGDSK